jgi:hypothetical protein
MQRRIHVTKGYVRLLGVLFAVAVLGSLVPLQFFRQASLLAAFSLGIPDKVLEGLTAAATVNFKMRAVNETGS